MWRVRGECGGLGVGELSRWSKEGVSEPGDNYDHTVMSACH